MSTHKHFDKICYAALAFTLVLTILFVNAESFGVQKSSAAMGYAGRLFDTSSVHKIDIVMEDWEGFISTCENEEYSACTVVIDGESYKNVGIRAKGNTSLTQVSSYGNGRYSFKIEFDCYDSTKSYYGLDKLCLNNMIQDNTYMKDYLTYQMMAEMGVPSPLCSYASISVNGETWGLYLALEGVEESFLMRNYGTDYGNLYKPDSMKMGGGRGNGKDFEMGNWENNMGKPSGSQMPAPNRNEGSHRNLMGSDDVLLKYIDDAFDSYANIFDSAKTEISDSDKERLIASLKNLSAKESLTDTVDIENVIRYFAVHNFVLNFDSYTGSMIHNYYLYENDGRLSMIPWDYNLAFGGFQSASSAESLINYPIDSPVSGGDTEDRPMIAWIFANEDYKALYHQYLGELLSDYFNSGKFSGMMDQVKEMISPYVEEDPSKFCTYEEFITGIDTLKEFCLLRAESIQGQLDGAIGATSETQKQDTLVPAGDLNIEDMGSMGNAMGGGKDFPKNGSNLPPEPENSSLPAGITEDRLQSGAAENPMPAGAAEDRLQSGAAENPMPAGAAENPMPKPGETDGFNPMAPPGMAGQSSPASPLSWILLGISACVLALGLLFALSFRRRR